MKTVYMVAVFKGCTEFREAYYFDTESNAKAYMKSNGFVISQRTPNALYLVNNETKERARIAPTEI